MARDSPLTRYRLVLWDIDKTLVDIGDLSREIYAEAFEQVTDPPLGDLPSMAGKTDRDLTLSTALTSSGRNPTLPVNAKPSRSTLPITSSSTPAAANSRIACRAAGSSAGREPSVVMVTCVLQSI